MIKHFQRFGLNVDDWPEANEDGSYPNGDEDNSEKPNEIDVLVTDEDVDPDSDDPDDDEDLCDDDEMCEPEGY